RALEVVAALVPAPVHQHFARLHAAHELRAVFAVAGGEHVFGAHGSADADVGGLVAEAGGVGAELAGALQGDGLGVEGAHVQHLLEQRQQCLGVPDRRRQLARQLAVGAEVLEVFDFELRGDGHRNPGPVVWGGPGPRAPAGRAKRVRTGGSGPACRPRRASRCAWPRDSPPMIPAGAKTAVARCGRRRWRMDAWSTSQALVGALVGAASAASSCPSPGVAGGGARSKARGCSRSHGTSGSDRGQEKARPEPRFPLPALRLDYSTLVPNEAWLSAGSASGVEEPAEPWTTITRPAGVGRALTLTAKSTLAPAARDAAVQVEVAERTLPDLLQCQPGGAATDAVAVIVLPAITSTGCAAATLPLLARVNAYCALNAVRGSVAGPSIDSARSACGGRSTSSAACAPSLAATGSGVCDCTAVARPSVPPACAAVAVTASENDWVAPAASESMVQVTVVVVVVSGGLQAQPAAGVTVGSTAWSNTNATAAKAAASGPALPTSAVKVAVSPGSTLPGDTPADTCRSADCAAWSRSSSRVGSWSDRRVGESTALRATAGKSALMRAWLTDSVATSAAFISAALARTWSSDCTLPSNAYE